MHQRHLNRILPALFVFAVAYFSFNSWLIAFAISLEKECQPFGCGGTTSFGSRSTTSAAPQSPCCLSSAHAKSIGVLWESSSHCLLVLYFTFKTSMDRVEDANRHVEKVNRLYLSTIETSGNGN